MPVATESKSVPSLVTSREPVGVQGPGAKGGVGDKAVMDAVIIVLAAWAVLGFLVFSLRRHNV